MHVCVTVFVVSGPTGWEVFCIMVHCMSGLGGGDVSHCVCLWSAHLHSVFLCVCHSTLYVLCLVYVLLSVLFVVFGVISHLWGSFVTCVSWYIVCPVCECFAVYVTLGWGVLLYLMV